MQVFDDKTVAVVGLGYVGLPLALLAAEKGWNVLGLEVNAEKVELINAGRSPIEDKDVTRQLQQYRITASTDPAIVAKAAVIVVAVPTPVTHDNQPDLRPLVSAITNIREYLSAGQTLVVESTINPGVMDEAVIPLLVEAGVPCDAHEPAATSVAVAHCPERINPGDPRWSVRNIPRVIGGYSPAGVQRARAFYESIIEAPIKEMASVMEAEAVKILENTFRDINIAFVNEMAKSFTKLGIDVTHVIQGAATKPFAFLAHYPGNGVGGHCISVDPYYMIEKARQVGFDHEFLKLARQINDSMPAYSVDLFDEALAAAGLALADARVALLGLSYKKNIDDLRESPALEVERLLKERPVELRVFDPYIAQRSTVATTADALNGANVVVLACDHDVIVRELTPEQLTAQGITIVIDGKNALPGEALAAAGIAYYGIGRRYLPTSAA